MISIKKLLSAGLGLSLFSLAMPVLAACENLSPFAYVACKSGFASSAETGFYTRVEIAGIIGGMINVVLGFVGIVFIGLTIYGGFQWMLARGNSDQVREAQDLIRNSIIGVVIIFAAFVITRAVFDNLSTVLTAGSI